MKPLKESVVLVTGAAGGIGKACAEACLDAGARVVMTDVQYAELSVAGADRATFVAADLRDEQSIERLIESTVSRFGSLDILVNNAAVMTPMTPVHETTAEQFDLLHAVNVRGTFLCCKYAYPHLRAAKGSIVNVSSMAGVAGEKHHAAYAATKGAINALTRAMAIDYGREGIRVNAVAPSSVLTPATDRIIKSSDDPRAIVDLRKNVNHLRYTAQPEEVAAVVLFLASPAASFMTGAIVPVSGGSECGYGIKY